MKNLFRLLSFSLALAVVTLASCSNDDDDGPSLTEQQLQALQGTWEVNNDADVTNQNETDAPGDWSDFRITFRNDGQVTTEGAPQEVGIFDLRTFSTEGENVNDFRLVFNGSGTETASVTIANDQLQLTFRLSSNDDILGGRIAALEGEWNFTFQRAQ